MKVLLATDGSKSSEEAAWLLSRLPHREKLDLTILTVLAPPMAAFYSPTKQFMDEIAKDDRKYAKQRQTVTCELFEGANVEIDCQILEGQTHECIVDFAKQIDADLVVLGAKGHSQIDRILLGSTSDYVATHAHCSVLVVRPTGLREDHERDLRLTVAFDDSEASHAALDELLEFEWGAHTEITLVAVAGYTPVFNPDFGFNPEALRREAQKAVSVAKSKLQSHVDKIREEIIEYDHIAEGLVRYTEDKHSDFLVIGDTGRSTLARALLGSVSRFVLRHAKCGVWITRHRTVEGAGKKASGEAEELKAPS